MKFSRCLHLAPLALFFLVLACNGAVSDPAAGGPAAPAPTTRAACTALGETPTVLLDEQPGSPLASDGDHLFFLRRDREGHHEALVRLPIGGGPAETVSVLEPGRGFGGELVGGPGRVAFTRGGELPDAYFGQRIEPREVLVLEAGASAPFVAYAVGGGERVEGLSMSTAGDISFRVQSETTSTLRRWRAGTTETIGVIPAGAAALADGSGAFVALPVDPRDSMPGTPSIARIEGPGGTLETLVSFDRSRKLAGLFLMGSDAASLYFILYPSADGIELRHVARSGGADEPVLQGAWPLSSSVIVDEQPSLLVVVPDVIFRQPKDGTQRTALVVDTGHIGVVTADACNVYWSTIDPPRISGRAR